MSDLAAGLTCQLKREVRPDMSARHLGSGTIGYEFLTSLKGRYGRTYVDSTADQP